MKTSREIRQEFLTFFKERGHTIVPGLPLVPNDPTLLFTNSGMVQFKDVFLGTGTRPYTRATDTQKCLRVSGKHNDLDEVGFDTYHHTFFEMLGNWSFGDYFKKDAIRWAWELLVERWGLDPKRLYATVHQGDPALGLDPDHEAVELWKRETSLDSDHIILGSTKDNFWMMGDTGPCGPCSEIHVDLRPEAERSKVPGRSLVNQGDPRVLEIWNLVFIQYNAREDGSLVPLQANHVDTGLGLERVTAALQGKQSTYETDLFTQIMERVRGLRGHSKAEMEANPAPYRVLADHGRAMSFMLAEGIVPGNEKQKYVLRMVMRRAIRFGKKLGLEKPFMAEVAQAVIEQMGEVFPELQQSRTTILKWAEQEEKLFNKTLDRGLDYFQDLVCKLKGQGKAVIPGEDAFYLHDTLGFPIEVTKDLAKEHQLAVDTDAFIHEMEKQRERSRVAIVEEAMSLGVTFGAVVLPGPRKFEGMQLSQTGFVGYSKLSKAAELLDIPWVSSEEKVDSASLSRPAVRGQNAVLCFSETPFYAESGGQTADVGLISFRSRGRVANAKVRSVKRTAGGIFLHYADIIEGEFHVSDKCKLEVDQERRKATQRNHTATHILHAALHKVVGEHAKQAGSLVAPDELRFDFTHFEALKPEQIKAIEDFANRLILDNLKVEIKETSLEEAKALGAMALFAEDYQGKDKVRMVSILDEHGVALSRELCGGTHVKQTGEIGGFKIISAESVSAGVRRVKVATGMNLIHYLDERELLLHKAANLLETAPADLLPRLEALIKERDQLGKAIHHLRAQQVLSQVDQYVQQSQRYGDAQAIVAQADLGGDDLKQLADLLEGKLGSGVVLLGSADEGRVQLVCKVSKPLIQKIKAGDVIKTLTPIVGGGGGGAPHFAQGGGTKPDMLHKALEKGKALIQAALK